MTLRDLRPRHDLAPGYLEGSDGKLYDASAFVAYPLPIFDLSDVAARVLDAGPPSWLIEGLWPSDAYGVLGAEDKAGKTWAVDDLAVSKATGTPWLNRFTCPDPSPVLLFHGEGGERNLVRRLRAISADRGFELEDLGGLRVSPRVPRLNSEEQLNVVRKELESRPAELVILDPLYLAAPAGKGADLYAMGEALYGLQLACQEAGAALVVVTHWNKTGEGSTAKRFTGVGPGAWGRVLASAAVERRATDEDGASNVLLRFEFTGSEIADQSFRVRRRVWATDPADLSSPLVYEVEVTDVGADVRAGGLSRTEERILAALDGGVRLSVRETGDRLAEDGLGRPLKHDTISKALNKLAVEGRADGEQPGNGLPGLWWKV